MKKIVILMCVLAVCCVGLVGCGKPSGMSKDVYNNSVAIIDVLDKYLDLEIDAKEAHEKVERLLSRFEVSAADNVENRLAEAQAETIETQLSSAEYNALSPNASKQSGGQDNKLLESRNKLAEHIGKKKR